MKTRSTFSDLGITVDGAGNPDLMALPVNEVIDLFKSTGLVTFSGFHTDMGVFESFTSQFSNDYMDHKGGGSLREVINKEGDGTILSVSYAYNPNKAAYDNKNQQTFPLALHSDRSYVRSKPPLMWFYCVQPATQDGQTTVCDGIQVYEELSDATKQLFQQQRIKYIRNYSKAEWQLLLKSESTDEVSKYCEENGLNLTIHPDGAITTEYTTHAIVKTRWGQHQAFVNSMLLVLWQEDVLQSQRSVVRMEDGSKIPAAALADIKEVSERLTHDIAWNPGEIAMVDNTRLLHGRRAFSDPKRVIYVRMAKDVPW